MEVLHPTQSCLHTCLVSLVQLALLVLGGHDRNTKKGARAGTYTSGVTYTLVFLVTASALLASADSWHALARDSCVQVQSLEIALQLFSSELVPGLVYPCGTPCFFAWPNPVPQRTVQGVLDLPGTADE